MFHNTCTHHIEINIYKTMKKMIPFLDCCCVIAVLPKCTLTTFSLIIFLTSSSSNQFNRIWNHITIIITNQKKMNMVRSDSIIQYHQTIALLSFIEPLKPSPAILGKLQQKLSFMTAVSYMPYLPRDIMSFCSCH